MADNVLSQQFRQVSIGESAKSKSMWAGEHAPSLKKAYMCNAKVEYKQIEYSGALYKIFDEVLVNAMDAHSKQTAETPKAFRITEIRISFQEGTVKIFNNGNGIPIGYVKNLKGDLVYVPELVSTEFLAGSNNDDNPDRITGGSHGLGLTLVNNSSKLFTLETFDLERELFFHQDTHDRLARVDKAVVTKGKTKNGIGKGNGTLISFLPEYSAFGYQEVNEGVFSIYEPLFKLRAVQIAAHSGINVFYNGEKLGVKNLKDYADLHVPHLMKEFVNCALIGKYDWDVVVGISASGSFESNSIINGVAIPNGSHINYLKDLLFEELKPHAERLLKKFVNVKRSMIQNNLFIIISGKISSPAFTSQIKDNISDPVAKYKEYSFSKVQIGKIWKMLEPILIEQYISKSDKAVPSKKSSTAGIKKYRKAEYAGTSKSGQCTLLICEGDSAEGMARGAMMSSEVPLSFQTFGTFNIGGVPMNARKKVSYMDDRMVRQKTLDDNERLTSLAKVLNLKHSCKYDGPNFDSLSYGQVVLCVDQDLDGIGQIGGIIVSHFELFWPELIKRGYLKIFATPILRAFPKGGSVLSFYSDEEYVAWKASNFGSGEPPASQWLIKYYKGLATHNDKEAIHMFKNYASQLYTFTYDDRCHDLFNVYYGKEPELRKKELRLPPEQFVRKEQMRITCTEQLRTNTKAAQLDNQVRKLPDAVDGLTRTARKVLCASRIKWAHSNEECKVSTLAGYVTEKMNYHHGSASLEETITKMAQDFVGANNFPLLLPLSQFGTRYKGGNDAGAPRYIKTKLNRSLVHALFRDEDDWILKYVFDEGDMGEPINYIPIAPFSIMESLTIPSTGFKYEGYARRWEDVYGIVKAKILGEAVSDNMRFHARGWRGSERMCEKVGKARKAYLMGSYVYTALTNTIVVTELPLIPVDNFIEACNENCDVASLVDKSSKTEICIIIKLKPGTMEKWQDNADLNSPDMDIVEENLGLSKCMTPHLNHIKWNNSHMVEEYASYLQILQDWFVIREDAYKRRIARECELLRLEILYWKEVIRFVSEREKWSFEKMDELQSISTLNASGYLRFNKALLDNPKFTPVCDMERLIVGHADIHLHDDEHRHADNCTYDYLFNITGKQCMLAAREARAKKLAELNAEYLAKTVPNVLKETWLRELAELDSVIKKANVPEGWLYAEPKAKFS